MEIDSIPAPSPSPSPSPWWKLIFRVTSSDPGQDQTSAASTCPVYSLSLNSESTIWDVKLVLAARTQRAPTGHTLIHRGVILQDWQRLVDTHISQGHTITVFCDGSPTTTATASTGKTPAVTAATPARGSVSAPAAPSPVPAPAAAAAAAAPQLSSAAVISSLQRAISPAILAPLLEMGFSETRAVKALILNLLNTELAMDWLLEHGDDPDIDVPITAQQLQHVARAFRPLLGASARPAAANVEAAIARNACTYTVTGDQFAAQQYHLCRTCGLVDGRGCCVSCARVCHAGHDLSPAITSESFFCDCGSGDAPHPCQALNNNNNASASPAFSPITSASPAPSGSPSLSPSPLDADMSSRPTVRQRFPPLIVFGTPTPTPAPADVTAPSTSETQPSAARSPSMAASPSPSPDTAPSPLTPPAPLPVVAMPPLNFNTSEPTDFIQNRHYECSYEVSFTSLQEQITQQLQQAGITLSSSDVVTLSSLLDYVDGGLADPAAALTAKSLPDEEMQLAQTILKLKHPEIVLRFAHVLLLYGFVGIEMITSNDTWNIVEPSTSTSASTSTSTSTSLFSSCLSILSSFDSTTPSTWSLPNLALDCLINMTYEPYVIYRYVGHMNKLLESLSPLIGLDVPPTSSSTSTPSSTSDTSVQARNLRVKHLTILHNLSLWSRLPASQKDRDTWYTLVTYLITQATQVCRSDPDLSLAREAILILAQTLYDQPEAQHIAHQQGVGVVVTVFVSITQSAIGTCAQLVLDALKQHSFQYTHPLPQARPLRNIT